VSLLHPTRLGSIVSVLDAVVRHGATRQLCFVIKDLYWSRGFRKSVSEKLLKLRMELVLLSRRNSWTTSAKRTPSFKVTKKNRRIQQCDLGPMLWFFKYFCQKIQRKNWRFWLGNKAKLCNILIITLVFEKNANFFAKNCRKSKKIVIITSTPDWAKFRSLCAVYCLWAREKYRPNDLAIFFLKIAENSPK
jgi:hypothetical protein